jgi:hypothetical protein
MPLQRAACLAPGLARGLLAGDKCLCGRVIADLHEGDPVNSPVAGDSRRPAEIPDPIACADMCAPMADTGGSRGVRALARTAVWVRGSCHPIEL